MEFPATSSMVLEPVGAAAVSVSTATAVASSNAASAGLARPEGPTSLAVQASVTLAACHPVGSVPHSTIGALASRLITTETGPCRPPRTRRRAPVHDLDLIARDVLVDVQPVVASEFGESGSVTFQMRLTLLTYQPLLPSVPETSKPMLGAVASVMLYVFESTAVRPPPSVYEQDAVCSPIPSAAYGPLTALKVAPKKLSPSSASSTAHVAAGTDPLLYEAPPATPSTSTEGAVFAPLPRRP